MFNIQKYTVNTFLIGYFQLFYKKYYNILKIYYIKTTFSTKQLIVCKFTKECDIKI